MLLQLIHKLYEIEDDVLGEEDLDLLEAEVVVEQHVPADRGSGPVDHAQPLNGFDLQLIYLGLFGDFEDVRDPELHLDLPPIAVGQDLGQDAVVVLLFKGVGVIWIGLQLF